MKSENEKIWVEGIITFFGNFRSWCVAATPVFLINLVLDFASDKWATKEALDKWFGDIWPILIPLVLLVMFIEYYYFTLFFLKRDPVGNYPSFAWDKFAYSLGQLALVAIIFLPALLFLNTGYFINKFHISISETTDLALRFSTQILAALIYLYIIVRCIAVFPLAISNIRPAFLRSWQITSGKTWRVFRSLFIWWLFMATLLALPQYVSKKLSNTHFDLEIAKTLAHYAALIIDELLDTIFNGLIAAFTCAAFRVLYQESNDITVKSVPLN